MENKDNVVRQAKEQNNALIKADRNTLKGIIPKRGDKPMWSISEVETLRDTVAKGATLPELSLFLKVAARCGLDPFTRQIHMVKRYSSEEEKMVMTMQTGIDGYRLIGQRTGEYQGQIGPLWCCEDGDWKDIWINPTAPSASKVGVYRKGFQEPIWAIALFKDYAQKKKDGSLNVFWRTRPEHMLAKCAEALALRRAFPQDLSGIHIYEEMGGNSEAAGGPVVDTTSTETSPALPPQKEAPKNAGQTASRPSQEAKTAQAPMSEAQIKGYSMAIYKVAGSLGIKDEELKPWLYETYKVKSTKELTFEQFNEVSQKLRAMLPALDPVDPPTGAVVTLENFKNDVLPSFRKK